MTPGATTDDTFVPSRPWHKASYTNDRGACVEVSEGPVTGVRDTKNRELGLLTFPVSEWHAFLGTTRRNPP